MLLNLAMRITLMRLALIPVFCYCIWAYAPGAEVYRYAALALYVVAGLSDLLDGYIARHWNQRTALGTRLDPTADKLMVNLGFIFLAANSTMEPHLSKWFPVFVLGRDMVMVLGAHLIHRFHSGVRIVPRVAGKANTFFQIACMVSYLAALPFSNWIMWTTVGAGVVSLVDYVAVGVAQVRETSKEADA